MEITRVDIHKFEREGSRTKAFATVYLDECFVINDIRVKEGENGLYIQMPNKKTPNGYKDVAHPINRETRKMFEDAIFAEFEKQE